MEYSVQKLDKSRVEIAVSVEGEEWKAFIRKAYQKTKGQFVIEGFRKGKVPFSILCKRYGVEIFFDDAAELALEEHYEKIIDAEKLNVVSRPDIKATALDDEAFKFTATVAVYPEFELGQYKGLTIEKAARKEVTDECVQRVIDSDLDAAARFVDVTDRAAKEGDMVLIDYAGSVDGVEFEGGKAEKYSLTLGSHTFIPGFEEQIVGKKPGESFDVSVTFPEDYHAESLKGKAAVFKCFLHEIKVKELPAADDEFAKDLGEYDTFAEYKEGIKSRLIADEERKATAEENNALLERIVDGTEVELPDAMVDDEVDRQINDMKSSMQMYGLKFEDYLGYIGSTEEKMREEMRERAARDVKASVVLPELIRRENLFPTEEEFKAETEREAEKAGKSREDYLKDADEREVNAIFQRMTSEKLYKFLRENNTLEDKGAEKASAGKTAAKPRAKKAKEEASE